MQSLVRMKFTQNEHLKKHLLKTGNCILAEAGKNRFFSIGVPLISKDALTKDWKGGNKVGQRLMSIRSEFKH